MSVIAGVMVMLAPGGKVPKEKDRTWKNAKAGIMGNVIEFLNNLLNYDKETSNLVRLYLPESFVKHRSANWPRY